MDSPSKTVTKRRRPGFFFFAALAAVLTLVAVLVWAYFRLDTRQETLAKLEDGYRAAGVPLTLQELADSYGDVPFEENAAVNYVEAFRIVEAGGPKSDEQFGELLQALEENDEISPKTWADIAILCDYYNPVLALAVEAADKERAHYNLNLGMGFEAELHHLAKLRQLARLLSLAAAQAAHKEQWDQAADYLAAELAVARSLAEEPLLISQLVRAAIDGMSVEALRQALSRNEMPAEALERLQPAFAQAEEPHAMQVAMRGEIPSAYSAMKRFYAGDGSLLFDRQQSGLATAPRLLGFWMGPNDLAAYLRAAKFLTVQQPMPVLLEQAENFELPENKALLTNILMPAVARAVEAFARDLAALRTAQAAIAVERYRIANDGRRPDSLSDLVPQFLDAVPEDPFDGAPLRYRKLESGYVVYSVFNNRVDNGGTDFTREGDEFVGDWTFRVTR